MSTLPHRDPTVILTDSTNWMKWYKQLQARCAALNVWSKIDPKQTQRALEKPVMPIAPHPRSYPASVAAITEYHTQWTNENNNDSELPEFRAEKPSDFTATGKTAFKDDDAFYRNELETFKIRDRDYESEQAKIAKIAEYIQTTVSPHLAYHSLTAGDPLRVWVANLAATAGVDNEEEERRARDRYQAAIKQMKNLSHWDVWLMEFDQAVTEGKALRIPDCLSERYIKDDFNRAVDKITPQWTAAFMQSGLRDPTVGTKEMIKQYREYLVIKHPLKTRTTKAAFAASGPTLNSEEGDDTATRENNSARGRGRRRGRGRGNRQGRQDTRRCKVCNQPHELSACWYAYLKSAPEWWTPSEPLLAMSKQRLENSTDLQEEVRSSKRQRSRAPYIKRGQSSTLGSETTD
ncbi:hypothetical protein BDV95DRAFT_501923 [Massariosphaeria phaeospora]|uniref:Gag protein n=1 Tax=Massariosphaeria phaeospora TaxID=100035 RepID=A0A7C8I8H4_9PLEO|nr:hypothetical protein BDV95DRAFT_501923 [Massariosphaeria phaeospora]